MPDQSFRTHLKNLEQQGEMIRFTKEVDPVANMAAVEWKAFNDLGKSSLFVNIKGHEGWQACSQILADRRKWSIALGIDEEELLETVGGRLKKPIGSMPGEPRRRTGEGSGADGRRRRPWRHPRHEDIGQGRRAVPGLRPRLHQGPREDRRA